MSMAPIGGDVAGIRGHASRYSSTARAVSEAVDMLQAVISASQQETSEAVEALAGTIGDTKTFLSRIATGRDMSVEAVDSVGQGRVWLGAKAKELGLVDELGGLETAIRLAARLAGLPAAAAAG